MSGGIQGILFPRLLFPDIMGQKEYMQFTIQAYKDEMIGVVDFSACWIIMI